MPGNREQLDLDSRLVLYIAGELTNGQKTALEERLAGDPKLAAELARLREAQMLCADALRDADEQVHPPVSESVAVRRVGRAMAQWQADRARMVPADVARGRRIPWWAYPAGAAAIIIVGFLIWSSRQPIGLPAPEQLAKNTAPDTSVATTDEADPNEALADWMDKSFDVPEMNPGSALSIPQPLPGSDDASASTPLNLPPEEIFQ